MSQSILYYPNINIESDLWLRNALLYWDNIFSIVPYEDYEYFSPDLLYLKNLGVYRPFYPQELFCSEFSEDFIETFMRRLKVYARRAKYNLGNRGTTNIHRNKIHSPILYQKIHNNKTTPEIIRLLDESGFLKDYNNDGWMEIDEVVSSVYMRTLAEFIIKCHDENIVIGTDKQRNQDKIYNTYFANDKPQNACFHISLNNCLPRPTENISFEDILEFKNKFSDDLARFRIILCEYEKNVFKSQSAEEVRFYTEQFKELWQITLKDTEKMFKQQRRAFAFGTLKSLVKAPNFIENCKNIAERLFSDDEINMAASVIACGAASINITKKFVNYKNKVNNNIQDTGFSYLLEAAKRGYINR